MQTRRLLLRAPPWFSNTVPTTHGVKQPTSVTAMMWAASADHPSSSVTATREGRNAPGDRSREQLGWLMSKHNNICTINHTTPERHSQPLPNANAGAAPPVNDNRTTRCGRSGVQTRHRPNISKDNPLLGNAFKHAAGVKRLGWQAQLLHF